MGGMTDKPKPQPPKKRNEADEEIEIETPEEVEVVEVEEVIEAPIVDEPVKPLKSSSAPASAYAVVGNSDRDTVSVSKAVFKNIAAKKSLSVHHIQRRLKERGYDEAFLDKDGFYGDNTLNAMKKFQEDQKLTVTGLADLNTLNKLFENDNNVKVTP